VSTNTFSWSLVFECTASWNFQMRWGSEVASSNANLLAGSMIEVTDIT
jgi:hypothetical protein